MGDNSNLYYKDSDLDGAVCIITHTHIHTHTHTHTHTRTHHTHTHNTHTPVNLQSDIYKLFNRGKASTNFST